MTKSIHLRLQNWGWSATFYGVDDIPDDIEIPLPLTKCTSFNDVSDHMLKRFPQTHIIYRQDEPVFN